MSLRPFLNLLIISGSLVLSGSALAGGGTNCSNAVELPITVAVQSGYGCGSGDCTDWWYATPPSSGRFSFITRGSTLSYDVKVYQSCSGGAPGPEVLTDYSPSGNIRTWSYDGMAGQTVYLSITGYHQDTYTIRFNDAGANPTATPTPVAEPGIELSSPKGMYGVGETAQWSLEVYNRGAADLSASVYVAVELLGTFYFLPTYQPAAQPLFSGVLSAGLETGQVVLLELPVSTPMLGLTLNWYGAIVDGSGHQQGALAQVSTSFQ